MVYNMAGLLCSWEAEIFDGVLMANGRKKEEQVREYQECSGRGVLDYVCKG